GITGVQSDVCAWKGEGGQIDLLIDRRDQTINLCEMKFSQGEFEITKQYDEHLRNRTESFRSATKTRKALHQTFVTTYGLKRNMYSGNIQSEVLLDDLFIK
ncbi:MAG: ATP-binding protein, partial [Bacteroidales bacterium]|nr:ATP-binding protein [Bacteroidales bacterium]